MHREMLRIRSPVSSLKEPRITDPKYAQRHLHQTQTLKKDEMQVQGVPFDDDVLPESI